MKHNKKSGRKAIIANPKLLKFYKKLPWKRGISYLSKKTGLSRQTLTTARQQIEFNRLFLGRTSLSFAEVSAKMNRNGHDKRVRKIKKSDTRLWCRAMQIRVD